MHPIEVIEVQLGDRSAQHDARGVHHHIQTTVLTLDLIEERDHRLHVSDIPAQSDGRASVPLDRFDDSSGTTFTAPVMHGDRHAIVGEASSH